MKSIEIKGRIMTKLYFIRHGKTEWNLESRYQGMHGDSRLLQSSYQEIDQLAKYLKTTKFQQVYASPIKRAFDTAVSLIEALKQPLRLTLMSQLMEFNLGKMEGMHFDEVKKQYPQEYVAFRHHPDQYDPTPIDGENFTELINRMTGGVQEICRAHPQSDERVIIVSHGAALNAAINALLGVPLPHLRDRGGLSNTSTTILETLDQGAHFELLKWNDTSYLTHQGDPTDTI